MSQAQEKQPSHPPLDGPRASHEAGSDEREKANILLRKLIEQGLRDMAKSAQTVRDVMISAQPSEESSREQASIEYEERIAAIQALTQGVSDLQALMNMSGHGSALLTFDSHTSSRDEEKQTKHEKVTEITSEIIEPKEEEDDTLSGLKKLGGEKVENPEPPQLPLPTPQPSTPPTGVPLHLIPLVPPRSSPSNRRRTSTDPFFVATTNDEDPIGHFPAGSPSISRTLAYAMGCTQSVESSPLPVPGGVEVDSEDENETKSEANDTEEAHRPPVIGRSETSEDQVDNATQQHTEGEARHDSGGITEERLRWETKSPHKVSLLDSEAGGVVGEIKTAEKDISKNQELGAEFNQPEARTSAQPHLERRCIGLMEWEMEIRREKQEIQILEETLQAREKDLRTRLETVRQRLQAIRQRKALMDRQEDSVRQKLADASTNEE